jgi:plasmid stabilization system protein ParE
MKRFVVVFEESAQSDVRESYDWGRRTWGKHEAQQWVRQLRGRFRSAESLSRRS